MGIDAAKMCPLCFTGPLQRSNCEDLRAHRGECGGCGLRVCTAADVEKALLGVSAGAVSERLPQCGVCKIPVTMNGCMSCGYLPSRWSDLAEWDPHAKTNVQTSEAFVRAVKLLGEQLREEAARLTHERNSLTELHDAS